MGWLEFWANSFLITLYIDCFTFSTAEKILRVQKNHSKIVSSFISSDKRTLIFDIFPQKKHPFKAKDPPV